MSRKHEIFMFPFECLSNKQEDILTQEFKKRMIQYQYMNRNLYVKFGSDWLPVKWKKASNDKASKKYYAYMTYTL